MFACREAQAVMGCPSLGGFKGLGGFASPDTRPTLNYVMAGDVMRLQLIVQSSLSMNTPAFKTALAADGHLAIVSFDDSKVSILKYWGGSLLTMDVQALNDFSALNDVLTYVVGFAQGSGLSIDLGHSSIAFVSKVEQTGGTVLTTAPPPNYPANNPPPGPAVDLGAQLEKGIAALTASPTALLVAAGLGIVLLISLTKK